MTSIPLVKFSTPLSQWPLKKNDPEWNSFPTIRVRDHELDPECYGVEVEDESMAPALKTGWVAIFSQTTDTPAPMNIYSIGRKGDDPLVRTVVKNEIPGSGNTNVSQKSIRPKRKSFMTPTPLHIPGSRVSPIAESTHQTIFLKSLSHPEKLTLVPGGNLLWMHPLVLILKQEDV